MKTQTVKSLKKESVVFIIFGASGDLNWRKITPALYNLYLEDYLPEDFAILATSRSPKTNEEYRKEMLEGINKFSRSGKAKAEQWQSFAENIIYTAADITEDKTYEDIKIKIADYSKQWKKEPTVIYYMSVAPQFFGQIAQGLKNHKLAENKDKSRLVIEKPFGHDLESSRVLNNLLSEIFEEKQIYRIDHYLGKEAVQNIMAFRFANSILEPLWNRNYIEHVQISVTEDLGVGGRAGYYEDAGALRDMVQNHILQLLCLIAMETPINFEADEVRNRKVDVLRSMRRFKKEDLKKNAVRGQYSQGWMQGSEVPGYREEKGVDPESNTETFAALKFFVDNWRWHGVPFYVRTGKRMPEKSSVIAIQFRDVPHQVFPEETSDNWRQNRLVISIQPEMSIRLQLQTKKPGLEMVLNTVDMVFNYDSTEEAETPEAYETLILDTIEGDQTLFMRADQVEEAWELLMPVLNSWESKESIDFPNYKADTFGPELAEALIAQDGYHWFSTPKTKKDK